MGASELRVKYLEFVQAAIARMSGYSAAAKTFSLTLTTAVATVAVTLKRPEIALLLLPVVLIMAMVDAQYLKLERSYRRLFNDVRVQPWTDQPDFSMDVSAAPEKWAVALFSWSVLSFYIPLFAIIAGVVCLAKL